MRFPARTALALLAAAAACSTPARADRAEAETHLRDGDARFNARDTPGAVAAYTRAIAADPGWALAWGKRAFAKFNNVQYNGSLEDFGEAMRLQPEASEWRLGRLQAYLALDRVAEALEDGETLMAVAPEHPTSRIFHGWALLQSGDVDGGLKLMTDGLEDSGNDPRMRLRGEGFRVKADWPALLEESQQAWAGGVRDAGTRFNLIVALTELGRFEEARAAAAEIPPHTTTAHYCRAYLAATPAGGAHHDPAKAIADARVAAEGTADSTVLCVLARALYFGGRVDECLDLLSTRGRRAHYETLFWLGAAYWNRGRHAEARAVLRDARRLNPYLLKHADRIEGFREFATAVDRDLAGESGDRGRLGYELATHLLTVAEIEALVRRYAFDRAVAEYEKLLPGLKSSVRKAEVESRLPEVRGMAGAHARLIAGVNRAPGKFKAKVGELELKLAKGEQEAFRFTITGGEGKFPWAYFDPVQYGELAGSLDLKPEELLGLGCLLWEAGAQAAASRYFDDAVKKQAALKKNLSVFIARKRGMAPPEGGFISWRGGYVTPAEKANLEKGLVLFQGEWVPAADREKLARGQIRIDGRWVPGEEAELVRRGFRKHKDQWMSREDYEELRSRWEEAWVESTAHYEVRTNEGEQFAKDLATLAEAAYAEFRAFYGGAEPKADPRNRMTLYAFRGYEDYRKYCVETKAESHLNAAGFAKSDSNIVVGWNKTGNRQQFLQTMVHEAAHLFYFRVAPAARAASWYSEATATYFEGFDWTGKTWAFSFVSESRLRFVRDAMKGQRHIPLAEMLGGDALQLINTDSRKALLFYAQCWALNYFLCQTSNDTYRSAYAGYRESVAGGGTKGLLEFFPDAAKLEADWIRFVTGL